MNDAIRTEPAADEDTLKGQFLTFIIGKELYGIEIKYVTEIVGIQEIIAMPDMPEYIKGIINLRGKIVPLMCVRTRFSAEEKPYDDRTCVIVADFSGKPVGLIVDGVSEVLTLPEENIVDVPQSSMGIDNKYVENIGKLDSGIVLLLNCEKLLTSA